MGFFVIDLNELKVALLRRRVIENLRDANSLKRRGAEYKKKKII